MVDLTHRAIVTSANDDNSDSTIKNKIGKALVDRIKRAHAESKPFRVIVLMPLMPAFEAEVDSSDANTLR
jgi:hypothetical protein